MKDKLTMEQSQELTEIGIPRKTQARSLSLRASWETATGHALSYRMFLTCYRRR